MDFLFDEIANEQESALVSHAPVGVAVELETFLGESTIPREDNPLQYWAVHKVRFPTLAKLSQKFLSAPCSSVDSERLFSSVSHIVDEKRNRLPGDTAEMLLFM